MTENGDPPDSLSVVPAGAAVGGFATILVIDASNSMKGAPIKDAMAAARAFAAKKPPNAEIGVVAFNKNAVIRLPPTRNKRKIATALAGTPPLGEGTRIYDALEAARIQLQASGAAAGSIVLLSDGDDVGSTTSEGDIVGRLGRRQGSRVHGRPQVEDASTRAPSRQLALGDGRNLGGGPDHKGPASPCSPISDSASENSTWSSTGQLEMSNPADVDRPVAVRVYAARRRSTTAPRSASAGRRAVRSGERFWRSPVTLVGVVSAIAAPPLVRDPHHPPLAQSGGTFRARWARGSSACRRASTKSRTSAGEEVRALLQDADQSFRRKRFLRSFADDCELADIKTSPVTLLLIAVSGGLLLGVFLAVAFGSPWLFLIGILVPLGIRWFVGARVDRKRRKFGDDLPDNLDVLAQSLRAGHSLVGALSVVSETADEPTKSEFARVVSDEQLGVPLDDALTTCVQRMSNRDLDQVAVVALIQRDAGGNAAEVIDQVAENVRTRQELRRLARTLTAQGRMARWILTALPIGVFVMLLLINKEYLSPLWDTTYGILALIVSAIMVTIGSFIIKRIVDIKV